MEQYWLGKLMNRRSFFGRVLATFAAAIGVKVAPDDAVPSPIVLRAKKIAVLVRIPNELLGLPVVGVDYGNLMTYRLP